MSPTWFPVVISVLLLLALVLQAAQTWLGFQLRRERLEISWEVQHVDDVERAWGIIANAMDWVESPEWQRAADSFRDDVWHPMLGPGPSCAPGEGEHPPKPKRHGFLRRGVWEPCGDDNG